VTAGFLLSEAFLRVAAFLAVFGTMAAWEVLAPRREAHRLKGRRWRTNLLVLAADAVVLRVLFPTAAVGAALLAERAGLGLFHTVAAPGWLAGLVSFVALDFAVWLEHVASHKLPVLWRLHRVHHADLDCDVTTGLRFHPLEILLSMAWKWAVILALGAPALAVLVFEIVLNGASMFNHSNARLPPAADRILRRAVVTPDMHRIHHSVRRRETDSNYGFNLSVWDRAFGTYTEAPEGGHERMRIGLQDHQDDAPAGLLWSLLFPFRRG